MAIAVMLVLTVLATSTLAFTNSNSRDAGRSTAAQKAYAAAEAGLNDALAAVQVAGSDTTKMSPSPTHAGTSTPPSPRSPAERDRDLGRHLQLNNQGLDPQLHRCGVEPDNWPTASAITRKLTQTATITPPPYNFVALNTSCDSHTLIVGPERPAQRDQQDVHQLLQRSAGRREARRIRHLRHVRARQHLRPGDQGRRRLGDRRRRHPQHEHRDGQRRPLPSQQQQHAHELTQPTRLPAHRPTRNPRPARKQADDSNPRNAGLHQHNRRHPGQLQPVADSRQHQDRGSDDAKSSGTPIQNGDVINIDSEQMLVDECLGHERRGHPDGDARLQQHHGRGARQQRGGDQGGDHRPGHGGQSLSVRLHLGFGPRSSPARTTAASASAPRAAPTAPPGTALRL